jgi:hypothetical protein
LATDSDRRCPLYSKRSDVTDCFEMPNFFSSAPQFQAIPSRGPSLIFLFLSALVQSDC